MNLTFLVQLLPVESILIVSHNHPIKSIVTKAENNLTKRQWKYEIKFLYLVIWFYVLYPITIVTCFPFLKSTWHKFQNWLLKKIPSISSHMVFTLNGTLTFTLFLSFIFSVHDHFHRIWSKKSNFQYLHSSTGLNPGMSASYVHMKFNQIYYNFRLLVVSCKNSYLTEDYLIK